MILGWATTRPATSAERSVRVAGSAALIAMPRPMSPRDVPPHAAGMQHLTALLVLATGTAPLSLFCGDRRCPRSHRGVVQRTRAWRRLSEERLTLRDWAVRESAPRPRRRSSRSFAWSPPLSCRPRSGYPRSPLVDGLCQAGGAIAAGQELQRCGDWRCGRYTWNTAKSSRNIGGLITIGNFAIDAPP